MELHRFYLLFSSTTKTYSTLSVPWRLAEISRGKVKTIFFNEFFALCCLNECYIVAKDPTSLTLTSSVLGEVVYCCMETLSIAIPMECRPLSTYKVIPVTVRAMGEAKKSAEFPTSSLYKS